jgi:hypothetical protein
MGPFRAPVLFSIVALTQIVVGKIVGVSLSAVVPGIAALLVVRHLSKGAVEEDEAFSLKVLAVGLCAWLAMFVWGITQLGWAGR